MLSRVADSIYWMRRYLERAEHIARILDVNFHLSLDSALFEKQWSPLISTLGDENWFFEHYSEANKENVIHCLTCDRNYPNSIASCVSKARENAKAIKDVISSDMWTVLNKFYLNLHTMGDTRLPSLSEVLNSCRLWSQFFEGVCNNTLSRNEGWHFARLGGLLERADNISRILDMKYYVLFPAITYVGTSVDMMHWSAILKSASAFEMYKKKWARISTEGVISFLVLDLEFPRSIRYCLKEMDKSLHALSGSPLGTFENKAEKLLGQLRSELDFLNAVEIIQEGLHEFLDRTQKQLNDIGESLYESFFMPSPLSIINATFPFTITTKVPEPVLQEKKEE